MIHALDVRGFVTLLTAVAVAAIGIAILAAFLLIGGNATNTTQVLKSSIEAQSFASACAEEALLQIREGIQYSGSDSLDFPGGECSFDVTPAESESVVESTGSSQEAVRRVRATVQWTLEVDESGTTTRITNVDWQEVPDF